MTLKTWVALILASAICYADDYYVLGAFGDSITVGFNASHIGPNMDYSWATGTHSGTAFSSITQRAKAALPDKAVSSFNQAVSGSTSSDMLRQVSRARNKRVDHALVLIGANDICHSAMPDLDSVAAFGERVEQGIKELLADHPGIKIDLGAIPNIAHMYHLGKQVGCSNKWPRLFCKPLFDSGVIEDDITRIAEIVKKANEALKAIGEKYSDQVKYIGRLADPDFTEEDLSEIDCFHPSVKGQAFLADVVWEKGWQDQ